MVFFGLDVVVIGLKCVCGKCCTHMMVKLEAAAARQQERQGGIVNTQPPSIRMEALTAQQEAQLRDPTTIGTPADQVVLHDDQGAHRLSDMPVDAAFGQPSCSCGDSHHAKPSPVHLARRGL